MRRRTPIALALFVFFSAATANAQFDIKPGLFNWWRSYSIYGLKGANDGLPFDHAGTNNSATLEGSPVTDTPAMPMSGPPSGVYCFPTVKDSMTVANHPDIDIGSEDFTIKGTFRLDMNAQPQSVVTILDKRQVYNGRYAGYAVFMYNDRFAFQMANRVHGTIGALNYFAPAAGKYRDGEPHTFVISARREPNGGQMWVDGKLLLTFSPLTGYLFTDAPLRFARHALEASGPLLGCLIEIQMYRYVAYTWSDLDHDRPRGRAPEEGAWFRFDEGASDYAFDSAGTMENPRRAKDRPGVCEGRVRGGALFSTDVLLRLPSSPTLDLGTGNFTIAAWVRIPAGTTGVRNIVHNRYAGKGYALTFIDGAVQFEMNGVKATAALPNSTMANNQWYLIGVAVRRGAAPKGQLVILSDNPAVPRVEKSFTPDPATLDSGQNVSISGNFRGCLDELMILRDHWWPNDYFGRLREDATNVTGNGQLYYGLYY